MGRTMKHLRALYIETEVARIISRQVRNGWHFDMPKAMEHLDTITNLQDKIYNEVRPLLDYELVVTRKPNLNPFIQTGDLGARAKSYWGDQADLVSGPYSPMEFREPNLGSRDGLIKQLVKYGWKPSEFTEKGNPVLNKDVLEELDKQIEHPIGSKIALWMQLQHRRGSLEGWVNSVRPDGRITAGAITCGTNTGRMRHNTVVNVPAANRDSEGNLEYYPEGEVLFGTEMREVFSCTPGYKLVGYDAKGLELRILAHYMDDPDFAYQVIHGDPHQYNADRMGVSKRVSKSVAYACVTMDTTVLTKEGWKGYEELEAGELVLTYNAEKEVKEWKPVLEKVYYESAPVVEMRHSHSFCVKTTPNHRWFVKQRRYVPKGEYWGKVNGRYMDPQVRTTEEINTESNIVVNAPYVGDTESTYTFVEDKDNTDWVKEVLKMSSDERAAFLQGFLIADGYKKKKYPGWIWSQNEGNISEGLLVASYLERPHQIYVTYKSGHKGRPMVQANIGDKGHITGQKLKKTRLPNQPVWCIRTENESFVMRQGNCITITGNTLYGAGDGKLGSLVDGGVKEGKELRRLFMESLPKLERLTRAAQRSAKRGYLVGLDGRHMPIRGEHAALNVLIQGGGAVFMKGTLVSIDKAIRKSGLTYEDVRKVGDFHDESQQEVREEKVELFKECVVKGFKAAQRSLGLKFQMDVDIQVGNNWAETH